MRINLPTNLLRSFVTIVDAGSMLSAAEQLCVTQSALSLQIKRLEELLQQTLFLREGRRLSLTPAGDLLMGYAREVLALHDKAVAALTAEKIALPLRLGMTQDLAEMMLPKLLVRFREAHPETEVYSRIACTADLLSLLEQRKLDIVAGFAKDEIDKIASIPMAWYGRKELFDLDTIPLALLAPPCRFREAAVQALEQAERPYRIILETPNLAALREAVSAGLGITCRTHLFLQDEPMRGDGWPSLPDLACTLRRAPKLDAPGRVLAKLLADTISSL